jgi:hypothetical protein
MKSNIVQYFININTVAHQIYCNYSKYFEALYTYRNVDVSGGKVELVHGIFI